LKSTALGALVPSLAQVILLIVSLGNEPVLYNVDDHVTALVVLKDESVHKALALTMAATLTFASAFILRKFAVQF